MSAMKARYSTARAIASNACRIRDLSPGEVVVRMVAAGCAARITRSGPAGGRSPSAHHGTRVRRPRRGGRRTCASAPVIRSSSSLTTPAGAVRCREGNRNLARRGPRSASTPTAASASSSGSRHVAAGELRRAPRPTRCCSPSRSPSSSAPWGAARRHEARPPRSSAQARSGSWPSRCFARAARG